jgi:hypothetical protein
MRPQRIKLYLRRLAVAALCVPAVARAGSVRRTLLLPLGALVGVAAFFASTVAAASPTLRLPSPITVTATGPTGAIVTYTATATDPEEGPLTPVCVPASGTTFAIGVTTVTCKVTDSEPPPNPVVGSFTVTVLPLATDTTPPVLSGVPGSRTVQATGPGGAVATYVKPTATDAVNGPRPVTCAPASGSTFPLGATTVTCSASDLATPPNTASATFVVTVVDSTAPTFSGVPASFTLQATGPSGAVGTYSLPTATDLVDGRRPVTCAPPSGSTFPFGTTPVNCKASDTRGNTATATFSVTVQDPAAPVVTVPASRVVEANGPNGSIVTYPPATAVDQRDGPLVATCAPVSGSRFPLGSTTVTCTAKDSDGKIGSASFTISVRDTTRPVLRVPGPLELKSSEPVPATAPAVQSWFRGVSASDLVDRSPTVVVGLPATFPVGVTTVPVTATDDAGNRASAGVRVTVSAEAGVDPSSTPTPDLAPPGNATGVKAKAGHRSVSIRWKNPSASDFDRIEIIRTPGKNGDAESVVYKGKGATFTDRRLEIGTEYRYLLAAYDKSGNRSAGVAVVVVGQAELLFSPDDGAIVSRAPMLRWARVPGAAYYNVQLFRNTRRGPSAVAAAAAPRKVLSIWPVKARFQLKQRWTFGGRRFQLEPGRYTWYVWPGLGARAAGRYGDVIGESTFVVKKRR